GPALVLGARGLAQAAGGEGGHADPFAPFLLELAVVVLAAAVGRRLAGFRGQPAVLGELVIGVIIGNVGYWLQVPVSVLLMHWDQVGKLAVKTWDTHLNIADAAAQVFSPAELAPGAIGTRLVNALSGDNGAPWLSLTFV